MENDKHIRRLAEIIQANAEAQYMIVFRGRSLPATFSEAYENTDADGNTFLALTFWDGDSGNLFEVDYRLLPDKVFMNGKQIEY